MIPQSVSKALAGSSTTAVAAGQLVGAGAAFTINGSSASSGVATFDTQRRVLITSAGNDAAVTFTVRGTNDSGAGILESLAGGSGTGVYTNLDFKTVTQVTASSATSTASVGTNGVGSSPWLNLNTHVSPANTSLAANSSGTVNYTIQYTYDDPNNLPAGAAYAQPFNQVALTAQTATLDGVLSFPAWGIRTLINSGTGTVRLDYVQAGIGGP